MGDLGSIPGLEISPGEGKGYPLQYSGLENSMDCIVHGVAESDMRDFHLISSQVMGLLILMRFSGGSARKESACNAGDMGSIPEFKRSPGEGKGYPLQYFGLENSMGP